MTKLKGRVINEELRFSRDYSGNVRDVTVAIPTDEFYEPGEQFEKREEVLLERNPVENAIEDVREGDDG